MKRLLRIASLGCAAAAGGYAAWVAVAWSRYGRPSPSLVAARDDLLDRFMPAYDVVERHHVHVDAPPDVVLAVASEQDLSRIPLVRGIFKLREMVMCAAPDRKTRPRGVLALTTSLGWVV